jgi:hypothetical protein
MKKLHYKLFPCIFCTLGYNGYVAGHDMVRLGIDGLGQLKTKKTAKVISSRVQLNNQIKNKE